MSFPTCWLPYATGIFCLYTVDAHTLTILSICLQICVKLNPQLFFPEFLILLHICLILLWMIGCALLNYSLPVSTIFSNWAHIKICWAGFQKLVSAIRCCADYAYILNEREFNDLSKEILSRRGEQRRKFPN